MMRFSNQLMIIMPLVAVFFVIGSAKAQGPVRAIVDGRANIYGAGLNVPPAPGGGGGGVLPAVIQLSTLGNPTRLNFPSATGAVSGWAARGFYNGPDGGKNWGGATLVPAWRGVSGIRHNTATMFLVGVFLGPNGQPSTAPATLDVSVADTARLVTPTLGQQFFVGDGRTSFGALQIVNVPSGATRLYLGFAEGFEFRKNRSPGFYNDNGGSMVVQVGKVK